jgi:hypothetical protein
MSQPISIGRLDAVEDVKDEKEIPLASNLSAANSGRLERKSHDGFANQRQDPRRDQDKKTRRGRQEKEIRLLSNAASTSGQYYIGFWGRPKPSTPSPFPLNGFRSRRRGELSTQCHKDPTSLNHHPPRPTSSERPLFRKGPGRYGCP